jgi:kynureninase
MTRNWLSEARALDEADRLKGFRSRFHLPKNGIYMDGNSLGLASVDALKSLERAAEEWRTRGIGGWLEAAPDWFTYGERIGAAMAPLVGAHPDEVVMTGSTTSNLHTLVATFFTPEGKRRKILADELNFPSDLYALESQICMKGGDPARDLLLAKSADGRTLSEDDLIGMMDETVALALLPGVLYRSGQLLDIRRLTKAAHERGVVIGFDCAHSVGSVAHTLHDDDVDFAFWCSYKHLNGGPGAPAGLFVNRRHFGRAPGLAGWFGYVKERQFDMSITFEHAQSAGGWQMGTPCVLSAASLDGALKLFTEAGILAVREKSLALTGFMIDMVDERLAPLGFKVGTPREPERRGGHVAVEHPEGWRICCALKKKGIIPDFRPPRVIRLAPVALYNTFEDVERTVAALETIVKGREYEAFSAEREAVS